MASLRREIQSTTHPLLLTLNPLLLLPLLRSMTRSLSVRNKPCVFRFNPLKKPNSAPCLVLDQSALL